MSRAVGPRPVAVAPARARCGACGRDYGEDAWVGLALERAIEPSELARLFTKWPADVRIEVRRCRGCSSLISVPLSPRGFGRCSPLLTDPALLPLWTSGPPQ